jgi:hypothetical protein
MRNIVSNIEKYFVSTGKCRDYTDKIANNVETVSLVIPKNGLQNIQLPQNSLLDNVKIRAIQILADDQMFYGNLPDGTTRENLTVAALPSFAFTLGLDNEEIAQIPFTTMHTPTQSGKYNFIDSNVGRHRIGDSFVTQVGAGNFSDLIITLQFWYD